MVSLHFTPLAPEAMYKHLLHALDVSLIPAVESSYQIAVLTGKQDWPSTHANTDSAWVLVYWDYIRDYHHCYTSRLWSPF